LVHEIEIIPNRRAAWNQRPLFDGFFLLTRYRLTKSRIIVIESKK